MFPYVNQYKNRGSLVNAYGQVEGSYPDLLKESSMCSVKFFDLYFVYGSNEYLKIKNDVLNLVKEIKKKESTKQAYDHMSQKIGEILETEQKEWFEVFENCLDDIPAKYKGTIAKAIFNKLDLISVSNIYDGFNAWERAIMNIADLIITLENDDFIEFSDAISNNYDRIYAISRLLKYLGHTIHLHNLDEIKQREDIIRDKYDKMCEDILAREVNLYASPYYRHNNIWGMIEYTKIKSNREEVV